MANHAEIRTSKSMCLRRRDLEATMGVLLAQAVAEVSVIAYGETLMAIKNDGLQLTMDGKIHRVHVHVTDDPSQLEP